MFGWIAAAVALFFPGPALAGSSIESGLPLSMVIGDKRAYEVYPSVAGDYLVYSRKDRDGFSVVRLRKKDLSGETVVRGRVGKQAVRFGVATKDGGIGYVSDRMGPISAWWRMSRGDVHVAICNVGTFRGAISPMKLSATPDGWIWAIDTSLEKTRRSQYLNEFANLSQHMELIGQAWRMHHSEAYRHMMAYRAIKEGNVSAFEPPVVFICNAKNRMIMIPDAFDGAPSPDGKKIAFVRAINGNYDIWLQDLETGELAQLTQSPYGDFEPAWSPDGKKIAFISNRDSQGSVRHTSIYVLDLASGSMRRVTASKRATDGGPTWFDAQTILFHSNRDPAHPGTRTVGDWNIWRVVLKGGY